MVQLLTPWGDPNRGMGPREALFVKLLWPLVEGMLIPCTSAALCYKKVWVSPDLGCFPQLYHVVLTASILFVIFVISRVVNSVRPSQVVDDSECLSSLTTLYRRHHSLMQTLIVILQYIIIIIIIFIYSENTINKAQQRTNEQNSKVENYTYCFLE